VEGDITTVGSDHSPSPPFLKSGDNFFKIWGGISGIQHTFPLMLTEGATHGTSLLPLLSDLLSFHVADRFKLPKTKAWIGVGADADLALVDLDAEFEVKSDKLLYRHAQTPYVGRKLHGRVVRTILHGQTVFKNGEIVSAPLGSLVRPTL